MRCYSNEDRYLGKIQSPESKNFFVKFYQSDEFEQYTAISAGIVDRFDSIIADQNFLIGTDLTEKNTKNFRVKEHKSIIYITYVDHNEVIGAYDLIKKTGFPFGARDYQEKYRNRDSIMKVLRAFDNNLFCP